MLNILQPCYYGNFGHDWPCPPKLIVSTCRKIVGCLSECRKITFIPHLFLEILRKYCKLVILGTLGMLSNQPRTIMRTCLKLWCLSTFKKSTWSLLMRYYNLKTPSIWLAKKILAHNLKTWILTDKGFAVK